MSWRRLCTSGRASARGVPVMSFTQSSERFGEYVGTGTMKRSRPSSRAVSSIISR
jgi:hypothetical protein